MFETEEEEEDGSNEEDPVGVFAVVAADVADKIEQEDHLVVVVVEAGVELAMEEEEHDDGVKGELASLSKMVVVVVAADAAMRMNGMDPYNSRPANLSLEEEGVVAMAEAIDIDRCVHHTVVDIYCYSIHPLSWVEVEVGQKNTCKAKAVAAYHHCY